MVCVAQRWAIVQTFRTGWCDRDGGWKVVALRANVYEGPAQTIQFVHVLSGTGGREGATGRLCRGPEQWEDGCTTGRLKGEIRPLLS